ncbi:hypothetical protein SFMTTN_3116 [Sulfuriferula multivorans]|uniref:Uncharacterized protein n=1 Tax=Sulfuriferula multivorans TaxID=1559896 RepID=A0A401JH43_9PROT|nr:hypothetical protein [Sulfuriferula multivorans]GBL47282.1 hypothetical protein SFMTTN_3116 [Sulfuriferula multivorans]
MKIRNLIAFVSLGLSLGATMPAFADTSFNTGPALNNAAQVLLASRDGDNEARGNGRDQADRRSNGDSGRLQYEGRRDERQGRFGYGFERRQEHDQRQPNNGRDRQQN